jgi:hypothetical protein
MNIFWLADDIDDAARFHCDQHVNKMLVEYAQILSTALHEHNMTAKYLYQPTHTNHPAVTWCAESRQNFKQLVELAEAVYKEKVRRFGGSHKSYDEVISQLPREPDALPDIGETERVRAMPDEYKTGCVVTSYRDYYRSEKAEWAEYRHSDRPEWL